VLTKSDPVTKHIEYIGHCDSSIRSGCCPKLLSVGSRCLWDVGKRDAGVWTKGSQITTLGRRRGRRRSASTAGWAKRVTSLRFFPITPIVTCATAQEVGHE
jgi:hypothetical protein